MPAMYISHTIGPKEQSYLFNYALLTFHSQYNSLRYEKKYYNTYALRILIKPFCDKLSVYFGVV